jgi:hypothetical protein
MSFWTSVIQLKEPQPFPDFLDLFPFTNEVDSSPEEEEVSLTEVQSSNTNIISLSDGTNASSNE